MKQHYYQALFPQKDNHIGKRWKYKDNKAELSHLSESREAERRKPQHSPWRTQLRITLVSLSLTFDPPPPVSHPLADLLSLLSLLVPGQIGQLVPAGHASLKQYSPASLFPFPE